MNLDDKPRAQTFRHNMFEVQHDLLNKIKDIQSCSATHGIDMKQSKCPFHSERKMIRAAIDPYQ